MVSLCDKIIKIGLIFLIVFTPLAFGTVHTWSITIMELTVILLLMVWIIKSVAPSKRLSALSFELARTPLNLPILLFVFLILFQLLSLPPFALKYLSPNTHNLYKMTLSGYDLENGKWKMENPVNPGNLSAFSFEPLDSSPMSYELSALSFEPSANDWRTISIYPHATKTELFKILAYIAVFFLIINNIKTRRQIEHLVIAIIIVGTLISLFGIIQRVAHEKIYWLAQFTQAGYTFGPYVNRDHFAGYMEMVTPLAIGLLISHFLIFSFSKSGNWRHYLSSLEPLLSKDMLLILAIVIMIAALFLSLSRGGIISFLLSMVLLVDLLLFSRGESSKKRSPRILMVLFTISAIFLIWLGIGPIISRLSTLLTPYEAILPRASLWKDSYQIIKEFPIFGSGLGTYQYIFPKYKNIVDERLYEHAHNDYLEYLSDCGILGFFLFFGMVIFFLIKCLKLWQKRRYPYVIGLTVGSLAGIISILFHSTVDFNLHIPANALLFFIILALVNNILHLRYTKNGEIVLTPNRTFKLSQGFRSIFFMLLIGIFALFATSLVTKVYIAERCFKKIDLDSLSAPASLSLLKKAIKLDPSNSQYHYYLGKAYEGIALKRTSSVDTIRLLQMAGLKYQEAIRLEPTNAWYHLNLGWVYATLGLNQLSYRETHLARILDPKNSSITRYLANWKNLNIRDAH